MTASREYIFLRNCQPATLVQGFQKQNEKHSKQNMHFGCISRIQGPARIVSPVQSLQIFSSETLGVRRAVQLQAGSWMWAQSVALNICLCNL